MARKSIKTVAIFSILQFSATERKRNNFVRSYRKKAIKSAEYGTKLGGQTMTQKDFTQEQLNTLSELVLAEMGRLREFGEGRSAEIQKMLDIERLKLLTLYNYLIA